MAVSLGGPLGVPSSRSLRAGGVGVATAGPGETSAVRGIRGPGGFLMGRTGTLNRRPEETWYFTVIPCNSRQMWVLTGLDNWESTIKSWRTWFHK